jgi:hypothetical protein
MIWKIIKYILKKIKLNRPLIVHKLIIKYLMSITLINLTIECSYQIFTNIQIIIMGRIIVIPINLHIFFNHKFDIFFFINSKILIEKTLYIRKLILFGNYRIFLLFNINILLYNYFHKYKYKFYLFPYFNIFY